MTQQLDQVQHVYARLINRDLAIIDCLAAHKLLTSAMLTAHFFPSRRSASARLGDLVDFGVLTRFRAQPNRTNFYTLGWHGHAIAALRRGEKPPTQQAALWEARRLIVSPQRGHLDGVNAFITLAHLAARDMGGALTEWSSEAQAAAEFTHLRPDAAATLQLPEGRKLSFWLEYDTATQPLARLADKVRRYRSGRYLVVIVPSQARRDNLTAALSSGVEVSAWVASTSMLPLLRSTTTTSHARPVLSEPLWKGRNGNVISLETLAETGLNLTPAGRPSQLEPRIVPATGLPCTPALIRALTQERAHIFHIRLPRLLYIPKGGESAAKKIAIRFDFAAIFQLFGVIYMYITFFFPTSYVSTAPTSA